jgi:hypothetical protein
MNRYPRLIYMVWYILKEATQSETIVGESPTVVINLLQSCFLNYKN